MNNARAIFALARADFLERVRRYSFLLTMLFALFLGYGAATGRITIRLGDYRGVYTSAWIGGLVTLVTTAWVSMIGFYIVKGSVDGDRRTGVGQILAATPLSKPAYTVGKFLSNFGVLTAMVALLAGCALVMQVFVSEDTHVDLFQLLAPFVLIAMPAMALTAAMALLFEMLPVLRGGVGNVLWLFVWAIGGIALPDTSGRPWLDPLGVITVGNSMKEAARAVIPGYKDGFALTIDSHHAQFLSTLRWEGMHWTAGVVGLRLAWFGAALAIALLAAIFFDRFDAVRGWQFSWRRSAAVAAVANGGVTDGADLTVGDGMLAAAGVAPGTRLHLTALSQGVHSNAFWRLFVAELRLAVQGARWWWYVGALGFLIAEFVTPLEVARGPLLGTAWLWPVLIWSAMGSRETRFATRGLIFSSSGILQRQLPACYLAGVAVAVLAGVGVGIRLLLAGQTVQFASWIAGAMFLPALAMALGVISGSGKSFEALLTALWYVGPINHTAGIDYTGWANGNAAPHYAVIYVLMTAGLLAAAFFTRSRQLRNN
jgi:hypothetical protein